MGLPAGWLFNHEYSQRRKLKSDVRTAPTLRAVVKQYARELGLEPDDSLES